MKILFLGDSITQGGGASSVDKNYVNLVKETLKCEVVNYGFSGTRIGRQTHVHYTTMWNYDFRLRVQIMEEQADKVFVFGGTNDYEHGRLLLGNVNERGSNTFCDELHLLINSLIDKYGKEKLCFILPLRRFNEEPVRCKGKDGNALGASLVEYVNAMRYILNEYGIDFLDLYNDGIPKPPVNTGDEYTVDGLHPNDNGHALISKKICEYIKGKSSLK